MFQSIIHLTALHTTLIIHHDLIMTRISTVMAFLMFSLQLGWKQLHQQRFERRFGQPQLRGVQRRLLPQLPADYSHWLPAKLCHRGNSCLIGLKYCSHGLCLSRQFLTHDTGWVEPEHTVLTANGMNVLQTALEWKSALWLSRYSSEIYHRRAQTTHFIPPKDSDVTKLWPRSLQGVSGFVLNDELPCSVMDSIFCVFVLVWICWRPHCSLI